MKRLILATACVMLPLAAAAQLVQSSPVPGVAPNAMTIDFGPLLDTLGPVLLAAILGAIGTVGGYMRQHANTSAEQALIANVQSAAEAAAGIAYKFAASHEGGLTKLAVHDGALAEGANYMLSSVNDSVQKLNLTPDQVKAMVSARLGSLLAADPTVSVGKPPPAQPASTA